MRLDWRKYCYCTILSLILNCAWVIRSREEINRPALSLTPLPGTCVLIPDSIDGPENVLISFRVNRSDLNRLFEVSPGQPLVTYMVNVNGKFSMFYRGCRDSANVDLGYVSRSDIQDLIDSLNTKGFFRITKDRLLYEHLSMERIYLFGLLIRSRRKVVGSIPDDVIYAYDVQLRDYVHEGYYGGIEGVSEDPLVVQELEVLKYGVDKLRNYFRQKALEVSDETIFETESLQYPIVPICSLDNDIMPAKLSQYEPIKYSKHHKKKECYEVVIKLLIAPDGHVLLGLIEKSSGYDYFDREVQYSVNRFVFLPPTFHGNPVYAWISIPIKSLVCRP